MIDEKLTSIKTSKASIKSAIQGKGVSCGDTLADYGNRVSAIETAEPLPVGTKFRGSTFKHLDEVYIDDGENGDLSGLFYDCQDLVDIAGLETLNTMNVNLSNMFYNCISLVSVPVVTTSETENIANMCFGCTSLVNFPSADAMDFSGVSNAANAFTHCTSLSYMRIDNLGCDLNLSDCPLDAESLDYIISHAQEVTGKTLTLGATNLAKLTDEQKAVATAKGWTLA